MFEKKNSNFLERNLFNLFFVWKNRHQKKTNRQKKNKGQLKNRKEFLLRIKMEQKSRGEKKFCFSSRKQFFRMRFFQENFF